MKWDSYLPCDILKPFVKSLVIRETSESGTYKVLPDMGLVIGFQFRGRLSRIEDCTERPLAISGISGLADQSRTFRSSPDVGSVLVYFKAAGAAPFFKQPLHELFEESVSLDNFIRFFTIWLAPGFGFSYGNYAKNKNWLRCLRSIKSRKYTLK